MTMYIVYFLSLAICYVDNYYFGIDPDLPPLPIMFCSSLFLDLTSPICISLPSPFSFLFFFFLLLLLFLLFVLYLLRLLSSSSSSSSCFCLCFYLMVIHRICHWSATFLFLRLSSASSFLYISIYLLFKF